ncbi:hypothetical protein HON52_03720 [Candidatus Uhrbacteria bacterium]|jgi:hypothetical protein|nr:hypothetical protein [Candidatus Uhrbacteria bacterium]
MHEILQAIKQYSTRLRGTGEMLWGASVKFFLGLVAVSVIVGVGVPYTIIVFGGLIDALVGARGIGTVTGDAISSGRTLMIMVVILVVGALALHSLQGRAKRWCLQIAELIGVTLLFITALPAAMIRLPLQVIITLLSRIYYVGRWRILLIVIVILAFLMNAPDVLDATVHQDITLGSFMIFMGADALLTFWSLFKMSPYTRKRKLQNEKPVVVVS